jgi:hypothetical protein
VAKLDQGEELELRHLYALYEFKCEECEESLQWELNPDPDSLYYTSRCSCGRSWDMRVSKVVVSFTELAEEDE